MRAHGVKHRIGWAAFLALILIVLSAGPFSTAVTAASDVADVVYDAAIEAARAGDTANALPVIEQRYRENPSNLDIAYDYAVVLGWANRPQDAVTIYEMLPMAQAPAPAYVLTAVARDYRDVGQFDKALVLYRTGRMLYPQDPVFAYGEILTLTDAHRPEEAIAQGDALLQTRPDDQELLAAQLYALAVSDRHAGTLAMARRLLALAPTDREARRQEVLQLRALGDLAQALPLARQSPDLFSPIELRDLANDSAAALVRKGELPAANETERLAGVDQAIAELDRLIAEFSAEGIDAEPNLLRARFDRIVALGDRGRTDDIIAEYVNLRNEGTDLPPYALKIVADAYETKRDPQTARNLYEQILSSTPTDYKARIGLFYTQIETEDFDAAFGTIDALAAEQAEFIAGSQILSPEWLRAQMTAALARYYAGDGPEAERRLQSLIALAPWDAGLRQALAAVWLGKGKPRAADVQFAAAQSISPDDVGVAAARADVAVTLGDRADGVTALGPLLERAPLNKSVERLENRLEILRRPEMVFRFDGTFQGLNVPTGGNNFGFETQYFTAPIDDVYRLYLDYAFATVDLPEGEVTDHHFAVGAEYTGRDLAASGEVTEDTSPSARTGFRGSIAWTPDDQWRLGGNVQIFSADTPLRALRHGITANSFALRAGYTVSDRQSYNFLAEVVEFSDGNTRTILDGNASRRLISLPHISLDAIGEIYGSQNSNTNVPYFSPREDFAVAATLAASQILFRRYDYVWSHALTATAGEYWQSGFGGQFAGNLTYQQRLKTSDSWEGAIGIRLRRQSYDGRAEDSLSVFGSIDWRF